jgi:hypothetical protein
METLEQQAAPQEETLEEQVAKLRKELKDGRQAHREVSRASESAGASRGSAIGSVGPSAQTPVDSSDRAAESHQGSDGVPGSIESQSERSRNSSRRSRNNRSGDADGSESTPDVIGALERIDDIPERVNNVLSEYKRGPGRPKKEKSPEQPVENSAATLKKTLFKEQRVLSQQEIDDYRELLITTIQSYGDYADKLIYLKSEDEFQLPIWGNLTVEEAACLTAILLRLGQRNPAAAATTVRSMIQSVDYIDAAVIVIPRVIATAETLKKRVKPRKERQQR